jgi:hypothetical protein
MVNFIVHDSKGNILRVGVMQASIFDAIPLKEGEFVIEGIADAFNDRIDLSAKEPVIVKKEIPHDPFAEIIRNFR